MAMGALRSNYKGRLQKGLLDAMVGAGRVELPAFRLSSERSGQLSYAPMLVRGEGFEPTDFLLVGQALYR